MIEVDNIPVTLDYNHEKIVGKARIEDGKLLIEVPGEALVRELTHLAITSDIRSVSLGFEYQATKPNRS